MNADNRRKIILIGHRYHLQRQQRGVYDALDRQFDLRIHFVDDRWPARIDDLPEYQDCDACIFFVRFRELLQQPGLQWGNYQGMRIMYDWDVHANYHTMLYSGGASSWYGKWPEVFRRHDFRLLATTGKQCRDRLLDDGIPAYWLPKAYDSALFSNSATDRDGICYFGNQYSARRAMLRYVKKSGLQVSVFRCPHAELARNLSRYVGCLICNIGAAVRPGLSRAINRCFRSRGIELEPGIEAMQKNFEVAACGCAPIMDWIDELSDLGFEDGKSMVSYKTFEELCDKLRYYQREFDKLREIGRRAGKLAAARHTWEHRMEQLDDHLFANAASYVGQ